VGKARPSIALASTLVCLVVAGCAQKHDTALRATAPDPIVARVDGVAVYQSTVAREGAALGLATMPQSGTPAFDGLVDQFIDEKLLADKAMKLGLDQTETGRRRLDAARRRLLSYLMLERTLNGAVTQEAVSGLYQEMEKAQPAGTAPETLAQARPRIVRFLTYDRVKDLVLDLRHRAKIEIIPQSRPGVPEP